MKLAKLHAAASMKSLLAQAFACFQHAKLEQSSCCLGTHIIQDYRSLARY
jgi:hypothetical protein